MRLSELQNKDIITLDGRKIGRIIDVNVNDEGNMLGLIIEKNRFSSIFSSKNDFEIKWEQIKKIGDDVILVNISIE